MRHVRSIALLVATLLLAACGTDVGANAEPAADPCSDVAAVQGQAIGGWKNQVAELDVCSTAVALATARLGWLHGPITSTTFRASICPPNARCARVIDAGGWVIFTFAFGDPVMIHVGLGETTDAGFGAGEPEPVPDWLIDEIRGIEG
jgi:hypothetical protein